MTNAKGIERIDLVLYAMVPNYDVDELEDVAKEIATSVSVSRTTYGPYNAVELLYPALIAISFVGVAVLNGFLGEIGSDLYHKFKSAAIKATKSHRNTQLGWISLGGQKKRLPPLMSLRFEVAPHHAVRFLITPNLDEQSIDVALEMLPDSLTEGVQLELSRRQSEGEELMHGRVTDYVFADAQQRWTEVTVDIMRDYPNI